MLLPYWLYIWLVSAPNRAVPLLLKVRLVSQYTLVEISVALAAVTICPRTLALSSTNLVWGP